MGYACHKVIFSRAGTGLPKPGFLESLETPMLALIISFEQFYQVISILDDHYNFGTY